MKCNILYISYHVVVRTTGMLYSIPLRHEIYNVSAVYLK